MFSPRYFLTSTLALVALTLAPCAIAAAQHSAATEALIDGVQAFKAGQNDEAIKDFEAAVKADPNNAMARLYLGTACAGKVIPDDVSPANVAIAHQALDNLQKVPSTYTGYSNALKLIAAIYRNIKDYDNARATELQVITLNPDDYESHYTIGVIDWTQAYQFATQSLAADGLTDDGVGNPRMKPATCAGIRTHNAPLIDEAIAQLRQAVDLHPSYTDAMQYLNLVYRRHADFACGDQAARNHDIAEADQWIQRSVAARKQQENAALAAQGSPSR